jgi:phosphomannomutase
MCHNPGTTDANSGNVLTMQTMTHKIHAGRLLKSKLATVKAYDGVKFIAQDGSWLMLRGSGTEPILRIYAEAKTDEDAQALLRQGVRLSRRV